MAFQIVLTIAMYSAYASLDFSLPLVPECKGYQFEVETENTSGGENNGSAEIKLLEDAKVTAEYFFYTNGMELLSFEFENDSIDGLEKGKYFCIVMIANDCYKKLEFEIL